MQAHLWRVSEVPGKRGTVSVPVLRRAAAQAHDLQFEAHMMWMNAICCQGFDKVALKGDSEGLEAEAQALADRIFPAARDALGADVIYWLTRANAACSLLPDPHTSLGRRAAKVVKWFGRTCDRKEEHLDGSAGDYVWQPEWLSLPAVPLLGGLEEVLLHCRPSPELCDTLAAHATWQSKCGHTFDLGNPCCTTSLSDVWHKYEQLHSSSTQAGTAASAADLIAVIKCCDRQLRRALAAVMLGRIVDQNLAAIKQRLWHPQGRLMQQRQCAAQHRCHTAYGLSDASRPVQHTVVVPSKRRAA